MPLPRRKHAHEPYARRRARACTAALLIGIVTPWSPATAGPAALDAHMTQVTTQGPHDHQSRARDPRLPSTPTIRKTPTRHSLSLVGFTRYASLFGVTLAANASVPRWKAQHAFNVLMEYIDNDEDGAPDNPAIVEALAKQGATVLVFSSWSEFERFDNRDHGDLLSRRGRSAITVLVAEEVKPADSFDATLEEALHLVTQFGWAAAYPRIWSEGRNSQLRDLRLEAQHAGHFDYRDPTCHAACQDTEFAYWALTSLLGGQVDRCDEVAHEWTLCTPALMLSEAPNLVGLLQDPRFALPNRLPDGRYR